MSDIFNFFTGLITKYAQLSPSWVLGILFGTTVSLFIISFLLSLFIKKIRLKNKNFFYSFSNLTSLAALVYCLAECYYVGETFTLTSALLTVCVFYLFSQLKFILLPANTNIKNKAVKKIIENGINNLKSPYSNNAYFSKPNVNNDDFRQNCTENYTNYAEFNNILRKLKDFDNQQVIKKNNQIIPELSKDIQLNNIKKFTYKFKDKDLTPNDKFEIDKLEKLSDDYSTKQQLNYVEISELNDSLSNLLKLMSKYSV
jgi:hypothetical protein